MENRINIAEILKKCPKGMELDCTMFEDVKFIDIDEADKPICIKTGDIYRFLTKFGTWTFDENAKCVIFPKGKTTWEGFVQPVEFKDGDIIFTHANCLKVGLGNTWISIFQEKRNGGVATYVDYAEDGSDFYAYEDKGFLCMNEDIMRQRLATEEEKEKLFKAIEDKGYRWNPETKTLVKLKKFKVGDRIKDKNNKIWFVVQVSDKHFSISLIPNAEGYFVPIEDQDDYELVSNKFNISKLKPFDKVLVRDFDNETWEINFFSKLLDGKHFKCLDLTYVQCIPYEGNEHLFNTTNKCDEFFKVWKS